MSLTLSLGAGEGGEVRDGVVTVTWKSSCLCKGDEVDPLSDLLVSAGRVSILGGSGGLLITRDVTAVAGFAGLLARPEPRLSSCLSTLASGCRQS